MTLVHGFFATSAFFFSGVFYLCKLTGYRPEDVRFIFWILFAATAAEVLLLTASIAVLGE